MSGTEIAYAGLPMRLLCGTAHTESKAAPSTDGAYAALLCGTNLRYAAISKIRTNYAMSGTELDCACSR
eukprot:2135916-Rhodomonas_salina.2